MIEATHHLETIRAGVDRQAQAHVEGTAHADALGKRLTQARAALAAEQKRAATVRERQAQMDGRIEAAEMLKREELGALEQELDGLVARRNAMRLKLEGGN